MKYNTNIFILFYFFFYFKEEEGIRDDLVTGVQTCALPIYPMARSLPNMTRRRRGFPPWCSRPCSTGSSGRQPWFVEEPGRSRKRWRGASRNMEGRYSNV